MFKKSLIVLSVALYSSIAMAQGVEFVGEEEEIFIPDGIEAVSTDVYTNILPEVRYEETQKFEASNEVVPETVIVETRIEPVLANAPVIVQTATVEEAVVKPEVPKAVFNNEDFNKALQGAGQAMGEIMVGSMGTMMKGMAPILASIEENKKLPQANDEMGAKVKRCMGKYPAEYQIEKDWNILTVSGKYEEGDSIVQYGILRNLSLAIVADDLYKGKLPMEAVLKIGENYIKEGGGSGLSLEGMDGSEISLDKMQVRKIDGKEFVSIMEEEKKEVYLLRNIGAYSIVAIQAKGEKFKKLAREFVLSLDDKCIKSAVGDDGRSLESIRDEMEKDKAIIIPSI